MNRIRRRGREFRRRRRRPRIRRQRRTEGGGEGAVTEEGSGKCVK